MKNYIYLNIICVAPKCNITFHLVYLFGISSSIFLNIKITIRVFVFLIFFFLLKYSQLLFTCP